MTAVTRVDLDRSFVAEFVSRLGTSIKVDLPGEMFRARGLAQWVEPRLAAVNDLDDARAQVDEVVWTIQAFVKVEAKGEKPTTLSGLADAVLRAVDPRRGAAAIAITDTDGTQTGTYRVVGVDEARAHNQTLTIRGDPLPIPGLDVATLAVTGLLTECT
jgi:hypothetical protein